MLEVTQRLGGKNYVLWGGREGYDTLLNTDLRREGDQLAPVPASGRRAQAPHRVHRSAAHRAQADGADQAPVRLRRRRRSTASWSSTASTASTEAQHRGEPRHAGGPQLPPRGRVRRRARHARQHRRQPRRSAERLGHGPVPELRRGPGRCPCTRSCATAASRPAASTSTPSCAARASIAATCSTPTSGARHARPGAARGRGPGGAGRLAALRDAALRGLGWRPRAGDPGWHAVARGPRGTSRRGRDRSPPSVGGQERLENLVNERIWSADR